MKALDSGFKKGGFVDDLSQAVDVVMRCLHKGVRNMCKSSEVDVKSTVIFVAFSFQLTAFRSEVMSHGSIVNVHDFRKE